MKDEKDLEGMAELVEAIKEVDYGDCGNCPLFYIDYGVVDDECDQIHDSLPLGMDCGEIRKKKVDEIVTYILERSLKDEG